MATLRETKSFIATRSARGVRIAVKGPRAFPKSRVVKAGTFDKMRGMSDLEFDGTCVMDLGIGVFDRR